VTTDDQQLRERYLDPLDIRDVLKGFEYLAVLEKVGTPSCWDINPVLYIYDI
jgi:hypothetical protein